MARLGDVVSICTSTQKVDSDQIWLLNLDVVEQQTGNVISYNYVSADKLGGSIIQFDTGNVLYSKLRPNLNKVVVPNQSGFATSEMLPLRPDISILTREYLAAYLRSNSFVEWAVSKTTGAKMPRLGTKELLNKDIPIPTIGEQEHITRILERISSLISLRKQQLAKLDELVKARFVEMFGDPVLSSGGKPMPELCEIIDGDRGQNYPKQEDFFEKGHCLFLNAKNVTASGFSFKSCMFITKEKDNMLRKGKLCRGDIVLTTRGTIGNMAFYDNTVPYEHVRINSGMVILRINRNLLTETFFVEQFKMLLLLVKEKIASGSAQPQLPISTMHNISILLPNIEEQYKFSEFVQEIDKRKLTIQQSLYKLEVLKKALMQEYFG